MEFAPTDILAPLRTALAPAYEIGDMIGSGGFAVVVAARDTALKRDVAIKVLRPDLDSAMHRERFRREAEAIARLRHPHIVPVYSVGEAGGMAYFVMPLIRGGSLRQRIDRGDRIETAEATAILAAAARALAQAHSCGIVHRDIKPDNILFDGDDRHVLLTDFGIALALSGDGDRLTGTGLLVGTPQYMSPEQASGDVVDARSDIYSLGVVAFEMLAGRLPFSAASVPALLVKQVSEPAPRIETLRGDVPAALAAAIARALQKDPQRRWQSAADLAAAIDKPQRVSTGVRQLAARISAGRSKVAVPSPIAAVRVTLIGVAILVAAAAVADAILGRIIATPLAMILGAFVVASGYGRMWTAGYSWRHVFGQPAMAATMEHAIDSTSGEIRTPTSSETRRLGTYAPAVHGARSARGSILATLAQLPRSEKERLPAILPTVDSLLAEAIGIASQLVALEGRNPRDAEAALNRELTAARSAFEAPARSARVTSLENQLRTLAALRERREQLEERLDGITTCIERIRGAVDLIGVDGAAAAKPAIETCLVHAARIVRPSESPAAAAPAPSVQTT